MDVNVVQAKLELKELLHSLPPVVQKDKETKKVFKKFMELYKTLTGYAYPIEIYLCYVDPKDNLLSSVGYDEMTLRSSRDFFLTGFHYEHGYGQKVESAWLGDWHDFLQYMVSFVYDFPRKCWLPPEEEKELDTPLMKVLRDLGIGV